MALTKSIFYYRIFSCTCLSVGFGWYRFLPSRIGLHEIYPHDRDQPRSDAPYLIYKLDSPQPSTRPTGEEREPDDRSELLPEPAGLAH